MGQALELVTERALEEIAGRIQRLVTAPGEVKDVVGLIARPLLRLFEWQPKIQTRELALLLESLTTPDDAHDEKLKRAVKELEANVSSMERAVIVHRKIPIANATWLWKLYELVRRAAEWQRAPSDARSRHPFSGLARLDLLPPLTAKTANDAVHVIGIDPLLDAARDETELLGRRRALFEAAREALLDAAAALDLDEDGVLGRQRAITSEIARIDRLQAAGISPRVGLTHQLREAISRGESQRAHAALVALDELARLRGDSTLEVLTRGALDSMWRGRDRFAPEHRLASLSRSTGEVFGGRCSTAIEQGAELARLDLGARREAAETPAEHRVLDAAQAHLDQLSSDALLRSALFVDGSFEVGGILTPVRVTLEERRLVTVTHPTRDLVLVPAREIQDVRDSVIEDPRRVLVDLAAGRLLARRFVAEEVQRHQRTVMRSEVRVYVLDGSSSMLGPRAAMRDALLVAELATLGARLDDARRTWNPVLFYRYFTKNIEPTKVVRTREGVELAIADALSTVRTGGTDIQGALLASFELVRKAGVEDPDLARAQIVLVTDGRAKVDPDRIERARKSVGEVPVGVSIIALGEENRGLRSLAARQRAAGARVFYHYVPDEELAAIVQGRGTDLPLHLPDDLSATALDAELRKLVDEIEQQRRGSDAEALMEARNSQAARRELQIPTSGSASDGLHARVEMLERDWAALDRRFDRWFPEPQSDASQPESAPGLDGPDLEVLMMLLSSVVDVIEITSGEPHQRRVDAIDVFERLLADAGLTPWRTEELATRHRRAVAAPIRALRALCGFPEGR